MLTGAHTILYSHDAEATRAFLRDVLGLRSVDAGGGWLVFALRPAEVAVHPALEAPTAEAAFESRSATRLLVRRSNPDAGGIVAR